MFVGRAGRYSPNSQAKDAAILDAVRQRLQSVYACLEPVGEEQLSALPVADAYVSMGRSDAVVRLLAERCKQGFSVINEPASVLLVQQRRVLMELLEQQGLPVPPRHGADGYWVKRGEGTTETAQDIVFAPSLSAAEAEAAAMQRRGVTAEVRAHVVGDLVKCYGVCGAGFFRYYYPADDGDWKLGHERHNGQSHHYPFSEKSLSTVMERAARCAGLDIYGGDCIIRPDGQPVLIDLNDWPSFSRCREEAAEAIAQRIIQKFN